MAPSSNEVHAFFSGTKTYQNPQLNCTGRKERRRLHANLQLKIISAKQTKALKRLLILKRKKNKKKNRANLELASYSFLLYSFHKCSELEAFGGGRYSYRGNIF